MAFAAGAAAASMAATSRKGAGAKGTVADNLVMPSEQEAIVTGILGRQVIGYTQTLTGTQRQTQTDLHTFSDTDRDRDTDAVAEKVADILSAEAEPQRSS